MNWLAPKIPVRPNRILTLAKFIEPFTAFAEAPDSLLHLLIARHPQNPNSPATIRLAGRPGGTGCRFPPASPHRRGNRRSARPARPGSPRKTPPYRRPRRHRPDHPRRLLYADPRRTRLPGKIRRANRGHCDPPRMARIDVRARAPLSKGFTEQRLETSLCAPPTAKSEPPYRSNRKSNKSPEPSSEHRAKGREFREIGVLLRVREPYASAFESTFGRFGIPARFHFHRPLAAHPAIQYLTGLIRSLLTGWDPRRSPDAAPHACIRRWRNSRRRPPGFRNARKPPLVRDRCPARPSADRNLEARPPDARRMVRALQDASASFSRNPKSQIRSTGSK